MSARDKLITLPNPRLRLRSRKVGVITDEVLAVIEQMKAATLDWEAHRKHELGVALAAVQIDQPLKIVIVRNDFDNKDDTSFGIFVNPEITKLEGELVEDFEGCLSVTDIYGKVPRYSRVRVKAIDEKGRQVRVKAEGFLARVFQHEIDHVKGVVFIDHIKDKPEDFYTLNPDGKLEPMSDEQFRALDILRD